MRYQTRDRATSMPINTVLCRPAGRGSSQGADERAGRRSLTRLISMPFAVLVGISACGSNPMDAQPASCSAVEGQLYARGVHAAITRNWLPPTDLAVACTVDIRQGVDGAILDFRFADCNDDAAIRRSVSAAVQKSSPLPLPANAVCFERDIRLIFEYNPVNRR